MDDAFLRSRMLLGDGAMARLASARVAVFGLGGVGSWAAEALARSGVGALDLIDHDTVSLTNLNRQLLATYETLGMEKTQAAKARLALIAPGCRVTTYPVFYGPDTAADFDLSRYDCVLDAVDTVTAKLALAQAAQAAGTPIISCMGTGNKLDASRLEVTDLSKTSVCPLARVMRRELGKRGIRHLKVVCSREEPRSPTGWEAEAEALGKRQIPGSMVFVPAAAGLLMAQEAVRAIAFPEEPPK